MARRLLAIGSGTTNYTSGGSTVNVIPKGDGASALKDSSITDNGTTISSTELLAFGTATASFSAQVQGDLSHALNRIASLNTATATLSTAFMAILQDNTTNVIKGLYGEAEATHTAGTRNNVRGVEANAYAHGSGGTTNSLEGVEVYTEQGTGATVPLTMGFSDFLQVNSGATSATTLVGFDMTGINLDAAITVTNAIGFRAQAITKTAGTISNAIGLDIASQTAGATNLAIRTGSGSLSFGGKATVYNALTTAGQGLSPILGFTSQKPETGADANVLTITPAAAVGTYRIHIAMQVSAQNTATLGWTATWTDSNGSAQAPTNMALQQTGVAAPALTFTAATNGNYYGTAVIDVNNAGTNIVVKTTFSGTSIAYKVSASIERLN